MEEKVKRKNTKMNLAVSEALIKYKQVFYREQVLLSKKEKEEIKMTEETCRVEFDNDHYVKA